MPHLKLDPVAATAVAETVGAPIIAGEETLLSMANELKSMLGEREDVTPERLARWINQAYRDIGSSIDMPELHVNIDFNTVASQELYYLPTDIVRTKRASMIDTVNFSTDGGTPLRKIDLDYYRGLPDLEDVVSFYLYTNRFIVLYPTPKEVKTIVIEAYIRPQRLTLADHSPIFSPDWHEALMLAARAKAFRSLLEFDSGDKAENDFITHVRRKINPQAEERTGMVAAFRPARSYKAARRLNRPREDW